MILRYAYCPLGLAALLVLQACTTTTTPHLDSRFGYAVNAAISQQTLNPEGGKTRDPVSGLGGVPAKESIDRYNDSFKAPPPTFEVIMGTGGGGDR